jgi:hypothetical protein
MYPLRRLRSPGEGDKDSAPWAPPRLVHTHQQSDSETLPSTWLANEIGRAMVRPIEVGIQASSLLDRDRFRLLNTRANGASLFHGAPEPADRRASALGHVRWLPAAAAARARRPLGNVESIARSIDPGFTPAPKLCPREELTSRRRKATAAFAVYARSRSRVDRSYHGGERDVRHRMLPAT